MSSKLRAASLRPADRRILEHLRDNPPTYMALVANRLGMPTGYVQRRRDVLVDRGFVEAVTNEAIYRVTERGERYLDHHGVAPATADADD
jgi:DNA-binding MarR family transcriptional regulator